MIRISNLRLYYIFISVIIIFADQITKYLIGINFHSIYNVNLILFSLDYVKNDGAAFNILSGNRIFLSLISIIISFLLLYLILIKNNISKIELISYSFILGGTIGNGIDRLSKGYVIDFINLNFINFPVFNIADISINIGFILILYSFIKDKK